MTHRYGRHGDKAWLRWRKRHFRRTSLTLPPQVAVLNVPLDFLRQIRKVTILMADGQEQSFELVPEQLTRTTVEANTEEHKAIVVKQLQSPHERFFNAAKDLAREQAEKNYANAVDPYQTKPDTNEARSLARIIYYTMEGANSTLTEDFSEAQNAFVNAFKVEYWCKIDQFSADDGATSPALKQLLVSARTDKVEDEIGTSPYADNRTTIRAYESFRSEGLTLSAILPLLKSRIEMYHQFYGKFSPAKEDHS